MWSKRDIIKCGKTHLRKTKIDYKIIKIVKVGDFEDWSRKPFAYCPGSSGLDVCTAVRRWTNAGRLVRTAGCSSRTSLVQL